MRLRSLSLALLLLSLSSMTLSQTLVLAKDIRVEMPSSALIAHTGDSVIFKYDDWAMNHHIIDPKYFYPSVDLTGWMGSFVRHIFGEKTPKLPDWMKFLAKEQSKAFDIKTNSTIQFKLNGKSVYATYSNKFEQGHIFLLNDEFINYFNILSDKQKYMDFIELLKG